MRKRIGERISRGLLIIMFTFCYSLFSQEKSHISIYFRVILLSPDGDCLTIHPTLIPTRSKAIQLPQINIQPNKKIGENVRTTDWCEIPLVLRDNEIILHSVVLEVLKDGKPVPNMELIIELADRPDKNSIQKCFSAKTKGNIITFLIDGGPSLNVCKRAILLSDCAMLLEKSLDEAGYTAQPIFKNLTLYTRAMFNRFGPPPLTLDPDIIALYDNILTKIGFNAKDIIIPDIRFNNMASYKSMEFVVTNKKLHRPIDSDTLIAIEQFWSEWMKKRRENRLPIPALIQLADEACLIGYDELADSSRGREILKQEAIEVLKDEPEELKVLEKAQFKPLVLPKSIEKLKNIPQEEKLRAYLSARAISVATAESLNAHTTIIHKLIGKNVKTYCLLLGALYGGGFSSGYFWGYTPDYFRLADLSSVDIIYIEGMSPAYPPAGPISTLLLSPTFAKQAADRNPSLQSAIMLFCHRCETDVFPIAWMSALISGVNFIDTYTFGPRASGWEWFDIPEKSLSIARLTRLSEQMDPYLGKDSNTPSAKVALLWAESSDLWHTDPLSYSKSELRATYYALRFGGVKADFIREYMIEKGELDKYKILFCSQKNVNRRVQHEIINWVYKGGTLVLTPGAMSKDEADRPCGILSRITGKTILFPSVFPPDAGSEFAEYPEIDRVEWYINSIDRIEMPVVFWRQEVEGSGKIIGKFKNGSASAREMNLGKGRIIVLGFFPGYSMCSKASHSKRNMVDMTLTTGTTEEQILGVRREGVPYWLSLNVNAQKVILWNVLENGVEPFATVNKPNIDIGFFTKKQTAIILLSNYNINPIDNVTVIAKMPKQFNNVRCLIGQPIEIEWLRDNYLKATVPLKDVQAILLNE